MIRPNENKMSDGGRERGLLGVEGWKSFQKWSVQRSAVRSIAWLGLTSLYRVLDYLDRSCNATIACLRLLGVFDCFHMFALMSLTEGSPSV